MESDLICLRRYAGTGDAEAFTRIVRAYAGMVFATACRITRDAHLAEDVTQGAFLALARDARHVRTNVVGWLHRAATHRALDAVRSRRRAAARERSAARHEAATDTPAEMDELLAAIDQAIARLPTELRVPMVLHFLQARTQQQVAAELGVDPSTVSRRIDKAVDTLRASLRRSGVAVPAALPAVLDQCGPQAVPAGLDAALVKIGLGGVGRTAAVGLKALVFAFGGLAVAALAVWAAVTASRRPVVTVVSPPATAPTTRPAVAPAAIDLIRDVVRGESWVDTVQSVSIESQTVWHSAPQAVAARRAALRKDYPNRPITPEEFPELRPNDQKAYNHLAFDDRRALSFADTPFGQFRDLWDGTRGYSRWQYTSSKQNEISIRPTVGRSFDLMFSYLQWPTKIHRRWFNPESGTDDEKQSMQRMRQVWQSMWPEAAVRGPVYYRGVWCWVVIFRQQRTERWYVGMDDHRLYGKTDGFVIDDDDPRRVDAYVRAAAARGGTVRTIDEFWDWEKVRSDAMPPNERQRPYEELMGDVNINLGLIDAPFFEEHWYSDYREVATGCWMPFTIGWMNHTREKGRTFLDYSHKLAVTRARINERLPDEWFKFSFDTAEGADFYDATFSPPLRYKWKNGRTPAEWQRVFDDARKWQQDADARDAELNKVLHQPAPAFGQGQWLNSPPRTWADFKGKVVLVDFWAEWCGPCWNDLPVLAGLANEPASRLAIVGVHTAGSPTAAVEARMKAFGIRYPVYIDADDGRRGFGVMMQAFGVGAADVRDRCRRPRRRAGAARVHAAGRAGTVEARGHPPRAVSGGPAAVTCPVRACPPSPRR